MTIALMESAGAFDQCDAHATWGECCTTGRSPDEDWS